MPKINAKVALVTLPPSALIRAVLVRQLHGAAALEDRDAAAPLRLRHAHGVAHRAPLRGEERNGDARGPALVDAPNAVPRLGDRKQRRAGVIVHLELSSSLSWPLRRAAGSSPTSRRPPPSRSARPSSWPRQTRPGPSASPRLRCC